MLLPITEGPDLLFPVASDSNCSHTLTLPRGPESIFPAHAGTRQVNETSAVQQLTMKI